MSVCNRLPLFLHRYQFELAQGEENTSHISSVQAMRPKKIKKRRAITSEEGVRGVLTPSELALCASGVSFPDA